MTRETWIYLCGIYSLAFAIFHIFFWRIFEWKRVLATTDIPTRAIIQISNLRLIYIFVGIACLCFFFTQELLTTNLGHAILVGMAVFWLGRIIEQFIFLPYNNLMINLLTVSFVVGVVIFLLPLV